MDYELIKQRITSLRQELEKIGIENRNYFKYGNRSEILKRAHEDRRIRVVQIRAELAEMLTDDDAARGKKPPSSEQHWPLQQDDSHSQ